jgi:hypothetical protein
MLEFIYLQAGTKNNYKIETKISLGPQDKKSEQQGPRKFSFNFCNRFLLSHSVLTAKVIRVSSVLHVVGELVVRAPLSVAATMLPASGAPLFDVATMLPAS